MKIYNHSQPVTNKSDSEAVADIIASNSLSKSNVTHVLEKELAAYLGKTHSLFTGNGSQALALILEGLDIKSGDEVIIPSYVCEKLMLTIQAVGATPVLCDTNQFWVMDLENLKSKISNNTKAIIVVHTQGINGFTDYLKTLNIPIIEDICQSFGALHKESRTGSFTDYAFTSFHGTKTLPGGEGGMLFVNDNSLFTQIVKETTKNPRYTKGTDVVSGLILSQFKRLESTLLKRKELSDIYKEQINPVLNRDFESIAETSMKFRYLLKSKKNFEDVKAKFLENGIHVRQGVDCLNHRALGLSDADFTNSVDLFNTTISIPILPSMDAAAATYISEKVNEILV